MGDGRPQAVTVQRHRKPKKSMDFPIPFLVHSLGGSMTEITLAFVVTTAICLSSAPTRLFGVVGIAVLILLHPVLITALLILAGVSFYLFHFQKRR